jgi:hypothetical protein
MLLLLGVLGCGSSTPPTVNGTVNYNGLPVTGGRIELHFGGDKTVFGSIDGSGKYVIQSEHTGKAKVTINTESMKNVGAPVMPKTMKEGMPQVAGGAAAVASYMKIPAKYADEKQTPLELDVKSSSQTKNFELTD